MLLTFPIPFCRRLNIVYIIFLTLLIVCCAQIHPQQKQQQYVSADYDSTDGHGSNSYGIVHRFPLRAGSVQAREILQFARDENIDVWQVTPEHVDIYFPPNNTSKDQLSFPPLPYPLSAYSHSSTPIPVPVPIPSHHSKNINPNLDANWTSQPPNTSSYHAEYHPLFEIEAFLRELAREYPHLVALIKVGMSGEGREMWGVRVSNSQEKSRKEGKKKGEWEGKMGFVITGAQHAREWIATATALYIAHVLVTNTSDASPKTTTQGRGQHQNSTQIAGLHALLDHFDFYIIPAPNPDGYVYTWEIDRFWYKNRMKTGHDASCVGVDMNRNWGYKWRPAVSLVPTFNFSTESSNTESNNGLKKRKRKQIPPAHPCSHWYPGSRPFQAPEVNHLAVYLETLPRVKAFLDLRSYGQMLSSPFSYSCNHLPKDAEDQMEAALGAISALRKPYGTTFMTGSLCSTLYQAHGNIIDWVYKRAGIKYAYAAHLRDTGTYGFALPSHFIRPVGEETADMAEYLAKFIMATGK